jgi:hypothetical protein
MTSGAAGGGPLNARVGTNASTDAASDANEFSAIRVDGISRRTASGTEQRERQTTVARNYPTSIDTSPEVTPASSAS